MSEQINAGAEIETLREEVARERALCALGDAIHRQPTPDAVHRCATDGLRELLGVPEAALDRARHGARDLLSAEEWAAVDYVDGQVDQALEMLNEVEHAERAAHHAQVVNDVTAQIDPTGSIDEIMETAVRALHGVLADYEISLRLINPEARYTEPQRRRSGRRS